MPKQRIGDTLWDKAIEESANAIIVDEAISVTQAAVAFIGSKNSGKTSIILHFLDREEIPKPTTALEYTFGRRAKGANIARDVGHIWELGGGIWLSKLLEVPLSADYILKTSIVLVVDLSTPNELWLTVDFLLKAIRKEIDSARERHPDIAGKLKQAIQRKASSHADRDMLDPIAVPIVIIGGKYDLFQEMEPEKRKIICKTLRFVAHSCGASLYFFSTKQESLLSKTKVIISNLLFGTSANNTLQLDHNKPLMIPFGTDSLEQIGSPPVKERDLGRVDAKTPMELWKYAFLQHFPQDLKDDPGKADDPANDSQYRESAVDDLRLQRAEELERYRKVCERRFTEARQALLSESG